VVAADEVVSRQARSGEARRGMAIEPFAPKDFQVFDLPGFADHMDYARTARETFAALRDCFRLK
jgi:hypothetical protein